MGHSTHSYYTYYRTYNNTYHSELYNFEMNKCTLAFFYSSTIVVSNMTLDRSDEIGLLTLGVYNNFQLSECTISHNKVNIIVVTKNHSDSMHEYKITNSWIAYGNASSGDIASGIHILFAHEGIGIIRLLLQNITLVDNRAQEGNLLIAFVNCNSLMEYRKLGFLSAPDF